MKKIYTTVVVLLAFISANAQNTESERESNLRWDALHFFMTLTSFAFFAIAIIYFVKMILDNRIKHKLIEKGAPDGLVAQLLQPAIKNTKNNIVKWVCILASTGAGLLLVDFFQPLGIHSIAIICVSLSAGFFVYYLFIRKAEQKK